MTEQIIHNLKDIKALLKELSEEQYNRKLSILSGAYIGQHVRHILEFYQCLLSSNKNTRVDYDERKRDPQLESDPQFAMKTIDGLIEKLTNVEGDAPVLFVANYSIKEEDDPQLFSSTLYRELAFNLDHSIHHQALIKIALNEMELSHLVKNTFGYSPSTIRHLK